MSTITDALTNSAVQIVGGITGLVLAYLGYKARQFMTASKISSARDDLEKQSGPSVSQVQSEVVEPIKNARGSLTPEEGAAARAQAVQLIRNVLPTQVKTLEKHGIPVSEMLEQFVEKAVSELKAKSLQPQPLPTVIVVASPTPAPAQETVPDTLPTPPVEDPK